MSDSLAGSTSGINSSAAPAKACSEEENDKLVPKGGARRRVLPPIIPKTSKGIKDKSVEDPLESVLPLSISYNARNAYAAEPKYKGNLPVLMPNSPLMRQDRSSSNSHSPYSSESELFPTGSSNELSVGSSGEFPDTSGGSMWTPFENDSTVFPLNSNPTWTRLTEDSSQPSYTDTSSLSPEPPASPLPPHLKLSSSSERPWHGSNGHKPQGQDLLRASPKPVKESAASSSNQNESSKYRATSKRSSPSEMSSNRRLQDGKHASRINVMSFKQFRVEAQNWRSSKESSSKKSSQKLQEFYKTAFDSFKSINETFKKRFSIQRTKSPPSNHEQLLDPMVQQKFVSAMHEVLLELPQEIQKIVLKGIINCLLNEWRGAKSENEVRAYFILLQNPMFCRSSTYVIYAHLLRQVATLHEKEQTLLTHWLRRLTTPRFRPIVERIHQFVTLRLFPDKQQELPPMSKCPWWIPSAMKVLCLLNNANNLVKPRLISYREFYNLSLEHIDVMAEFKQWQNPASHPGFTFCQHPYALSLCAKRHILRRDQERQMVRTARDELVDSVRRRPTRPPDVNQLFLNIRIRRQHLLQDSLSQIYGNRKQLKKKLRVEFIGEPGYDMGGLTKEWFLLLLRQVLSPDYGTFVHNEKTRTYWFATSENNNFSDYFLVGVLVGLAVYNCITLDLRFPLVLYRKLLSPPQLPDSTQSSTNSEKTSSTTPVGLVNLSLEDMKDIDPDMAHGFEELVSYEGNIQEDFDIAFQLTKEEFGILKTYPLKPSGEKLPVTNSNRREYVQCYLNWLINKSVYRQFSAFYQGFHTVCDSSALSLLCAEEVETLACGNSVFDLRDLKKYTTYEGFNSNDPTILHFWDITLSMPRDLQKKLLHFCTGSDRVPVGGMQDLKFKIIRAPTAQNMLPMAHTCFNQLLLPPYGSRAQLEQKLTIAVSNAEGFGLE